MVFSRNAEVASSPTLSLIYLDQLHILPLYNPIIAEKKITFGGAGSSTYDLYDPDRTRAIKLFRVTGGPYTIAIEHVLNVPYLTIENGESNVIVIPNRITNLIITAAAAGTITIREMFNDYYVG